MSSNLRPLLFLIVFSLIASALIWYVWYVKITRSTDSLYFGIAQEVTTSAFTISDTYNGVLRVHTATSTRYFSARKETDRDALTDGVFVQVVGEISGDIVDAEVVRLMKTPRNE